MCHGFSGSGPGGAAAFLGRHPEVAPGPGPGPLCAPGPGGGAAPVSGGRESGRPGGGGAPDPGAGEGGLPPGHGISGHRAHFKPAPPQDLHRGQTGAHRNRHRRPRRERQLRRPGPGQEDLRGPGGKNVLLLGAGEMAELALEHLQGQGAGRVIVANRTLDRGLRLAERFGGEAVSLEELESSCSSPTSSSAPRARPPLSSPGTRSGG